MLDTYIRTARALFRVRAWLLAGMLAGVALFLLGLAGGEYRYAESRVLLPALAAAWCLWMTVLAHAFHREVAMPDPSAGRWRRAVAGLTRLLRLVLALLMTALGIGLVLLSLRAAAILRAEMAA